MDEGKYWCGNSLKLPPYPTWRRGNDSLALTTYTALRGISTICDSFSYSKIFLPLVPSLLSSFLSPPAPSDLSQSFESGLAQSVPEKTTKNEKQDKTKQKNRQMDQVSKVLRGRSYLPHGARKVWEGTINSSVLSVLSSGLFAWEWPTFELVM